ncbi:MAG TPA: SAVED domain-containing protein, partial [Coriobacteriia bacterium]|nr:SAVED domain-containing protein [Coriobacteriia bacterium]
VKFAVRSPEIAGSGQEGVAIVNVSGTVQISEIPEHLSGLRRYVIEPVGATPSTELVDSLDALEAFRLAVRELFATIESFDKGLERLHVLAALPVSAAVALGRAHTAHVDPRLVIYERTAARYTRALEIA